MKYQEEVSLWGQIRLVVAKEENDYEHGVSLGVMKIEQVAVIIEQYC